MIQLEGLKEKIHGARAQKVVSSDFSDVSKATVAGRATTVLFEANRITPGKLDGSFGQFALGLRRLLISTTCLINLAELVMTKGDEVVVLPEERMPTELRLAVVNQFAEFRKRISIGAMYSPRPV